MVLTLQECRTQQEAGLDTHCEAQIRSGLNRAGDPKSGVRMGNQRGLVALEQPCWVLSLENSRVWGRKEGPNTGTGMALAAIARDRSSPGRWCVEPQSPGPGCSRWTRCSLAGGVRAWSHWLSGASLLAGMCPALRRLRLVGRGPVNLTLPVRGSPGSPGRELPPHHRQSDNACDAGTHAARLVFEGEREGRPGRSAPTASPGPGVTGLGSSCPTSPRDLSCGGMSPFRPVSTHLPQVS